jgi:hypothetical protein
MPKPAKNGGKTLADRINELEKLGQSGPDTHRRLTAEGFKVSLRSVGRALRKIRGTQRVARRLAEPSQADPPPPPALPLPTEADIEAADLKTLESWRDLSARSAQAASARGDLAAVARFGSLATSIFEALRKARPKEAPPEGVFVTSSDMATLAAKGRARLEKLVADMFSTTTKEG